MSKLFQVQFKADRSLVRHETFEGKKHLVVPVVMVVEGVLNGALVPTKELAESVEAWNGRPVPVLHPTTEGDFISANSPRVIEQNVIGHVFNARVDANRLKAEMWIDTEKAEKLGHSALVADLAIGKVVEVSTGYFADEEDSPGKFNGIEYQVIHRNLKPDHLALLPDEIGACSVADGCGAPRVNVNQGPTAPIIEEGDMPNDKTSEKQQVKLGTAPDCVPCEELKKMHTNGSITAKQLEALQELTASIGSEHIKALVDVVAGLVTKENMPEEEKVEDEELPVATQTEAPMTTNEMIAMIKSVVSQTVADVLPSKMQETSRRSEITSRLRANDRNVLSDADMRSLTVDMLEKIETTLQPADYSGRGGVTTNGVPAKANPLVPPQGILGQAKK